MIQPEREFPAHVLMPPETPWMRTPGSLTPNELNTWDQIAHEHGGRDPLSSGAAWQLAFSDACVRGPLLFRQEGGSQLAYTIGRNVEADGAVIFGCIEKNWRFGLCRMGPDSFELLRDTISGIAPGEKVSVSRNDVSWDFRSASLEGGYDGWLSRRSRNFRKALRQSGRKAADAGIVLQKLDEPSHAEYRLMEAVDFHSWKVFLRGGVLSPKNFYRALMLRYARTGANRLILAMRDGEPVGYCWAGMIGDQVRGQQCSYVEALSDLGLGRLMHCELTKWVCEQGAKILHYGPERIWMDAYADPH